LALERRQGSEIVAKASDRAAAEATESQVIGAWIKWYGEAFDSVSRLPVTGPTDALASRIQAARARLR
jgi:hypothetical protein